MDQLRKGMRTMNEYRDKVETLAESPSAFCWLNHDEHGSSEEDYCPSCARKAVEILTASVESANEIDPDWGLCEKGTVQVAYGNGPESESCKHCVTCGAHLEVTLLPEGVKEELEHFQKNVVVPTPGEWAHWLDVLDGVDAESPLYPTIVAETKRMLLEFEKAVKA